MANNSVVQVVLEVDNKTGIVRVKEFQDASVKAFKGAEAGARQATGSVRTLTSSYSALSVAMKAVPFLSVAAGVAATVGAIKQLAVGSVAAASALEETQNKFNVVFRDQLGQAEAWAKELQNSYLMSAQEAKLHMSSMQDLLKPMGMASGQAAALSHEMVKLAADMGSFSNVQTAQVMGDIQSALVGNYQTMRKYGTRLNETIVQEKALAMGLARTTDALTAAHKAQAAYTLIVELNKDAVGDIERSMGSYELVTKRLNAEYTNFLANLGEKTMPAATKAKNALADLFGYLNTQMEMPGHERLLRDRIEMISREIDALVMPFDAQRKAVLEQRKASLQRELHELDYWDRIFSERSAREGKDKGTLMDADIDSTGSDNKYWDRLFKENASRRQRDSELSYEIWLARQEEYQAEEDRVNKRWDDLFNQHRARRLADVTLDEEVGYQSWLYHQKQQFDAMVELSERTADAMEQNFSNLFFDVMTGQFKSLKDVGTAVLHSLARATSDVLGQMMKVLLFQKDTGLLSNFISFTPSAYGNVFYNGKVLPFGLGGVVPHPAVFPLGSMAEREPEAIMPLKRGSDGRLGVEAGATSGGVTVMAPVQITATDAAGVAAWVDKHAALFAGAVISELDQGNKGLISRLRRP